MTHSDPFLTNATMTLSSRQKATYFLLISSYVAGIIAVRMLGYSDFLYLTPFNLLMSLGLLLWNHEARDAGLWRFVALAYLTGYFVEVAGVSTGVIFGKYWYGEVLGWKLWGAPLLIGINWIIVIYTGNEVFNRFAGHWPLLARAVVAAVIPVALDWLIEPVAIQYGWWFWADGAPPLQNYVGWYVVSLLLSFAYQRWVGVAVRNIASPVLLGLQVLFFLVLRS